MKAEITAKAQAEGFDTVGFTAPGSIPLTKARLDEFLAKGRHGTMDWMETRAEQRSDPARLWPDVKSVIVLGMNYGPPNDPLDDLQCKDRGAISVYAKGGDYHDTIKKALKRLGRWLCETHGCEIKVFVDTAPVAEKPLAEAAGLGWQGKHTNLVSREWGSWLFLGVIYTTLDIEPDEAFTDHCGRCRACLDICPTDAFPAPYQLDARRCISYLTIEHKGHIPEAFRAPMGNRIYGCDDCLAVCPWNKFAQTASAAAFHARAELRLPRLTDLAGLDDATFRQVFAGSPIKRIGRDRFVRNVLIAIGNSGDPAMRVHAESRLTDPSALVRAMAVWAMKQLSAPADFDALRTRYLQDETDPAVAAEWQTPKSEPSQSTRNPSGPPLTE